MRRGKQTLASEANGTQGRLLTWHPGKVQHQKKAISAACPELSCRFAKEASASKPEMLADIDFVDVNVRPYLSCLVKHGLFYIFICSDLPALRDARDPRSRDDEQRTRRARSDSAWGCSLLRSDGVQDPSNVSG